MKITPLLILLFSLNSIPALTQDIFNQKNISAWCIVPFDKMKRGPEERIAMLEKLGFAQYVYDWRSEHIPTFDQEIKLAKQHNITMEGVWLWVNSQLDKTGQLSADNQKVIDIVAKNKLKTTFWLGFDNGFF